MSEQRDGDRTIVITSGTITKALLIAVGFYIIYLLKDVVLVVLTAIMITSALSPIIKEFTKRKWPRIAGVLTVYISITLILTGISVYFLPTLLNDISTLAHSLPDYVRVADLWSSVSSSASFLPDISLKTLTDSISGTLSDVGIFTTISGFFGGIVSFILIIILSFYLSVQEDGVGDFLRIIVPIRYESYVINLWQRSAEKIGLWMQGQILLGVLIGVLTYLGLSVLGVRNALFLALIAAIFELIPVFGVILSTIPALAIAMTDGGISLALLTLGLYVIIQQFESNLIYPLVVKKIVGIPSILVILTLIIGAKLAGFLGIILSVPAAAIITEVLNDIEKRKMKERI